MFILAPVVLLKLDVLCVKGSRRRAKVLGFHDAISTLLKRYLFFCCEFYFS